MKFVSAPITRPLIWFIALVFIVLLHLTLVVIVWYVLAHQVKHVVGVLSMVSKIAYMDVLSSVNDSARSLVPIDISTMGLARVLNSSIYGNFSSFSTIENQVAPSLFLVFSTVPHLSQCSYNGDNGLLFSYYKDMNQTFALFANMSYDDSTSGKRFYSWYKQPVNNDNGLRFGEAIEIPVSSSINDDSSSWVPRKGEAKGDLFVYTAPVKEYLPQGQRGVVTLGVPVKLLINFISSIELHGGDLFLATEDGQLLVQTGPPNTSIVFNNDTLIVHLKKKLNNNNMVTTNIRISCKINCTYTGRLIASNVKIWGRRYEFHCASLEIAGLRSVAVLITPHKKFLSVVRKQCIIALALLLLTLGLIFPATCCFIILHIRATKREILLSSALIKQMEATQQAERKSMNKSIAFANASHDVRTSLAAITGLIDLCLNLGPSQVEIRSNLEQMNSCASNLLGILNSVLDKSKIEAGKMHLEEEEFDLAQVLEEAVEIFYAVALQKGLDVMLDPCDGSFLKYFHVIGDCGRLKQILHNLLSNAVKFTSEGRIVVRAWVKKPSLENSCLVSDHRGCFSNLYAFISNFKNGDGLGSIHTAQRNSSSIEFIVEVDDTGKGIPKEKHKSVFENYVQVKESSSEGHQGTGLGLGIVQSLVRLMGGEIMIIDKEYGEKGTCFKFNVFLHTCEADNSHHVEEEIGIHKDQVANDLRSNVKGLISKKGLKLDSIHAVLLIQGKEESLVLQRWMECHGIKVWPINQWDHLYPTLEKVKHKMFISHSSTSAKFDSTSLQSYSGELISYLSNEIEKDGHPFSSNVIGKDIYRKTGQSGEPNCVLIIIDMSCGHFLEACSALTYFNKSTHDLLYKVVWMVDPTTPHIDLESIENKQAPCDLILQKPFHRSRFCAIIQLLQDCGDDACRPNVIKMRNMTQGAQDSIKLSSKELHQNTCDSTSFESSILTQQSNGLEGNLSNEKPLSGINILVVEDNVVLRHLAITNLSRLGATVEYCENGEDALNLIRQALQEINVMQNGNHFDEGVPGLFKGFSYDVVLMDCEMPIMDGYEATKMIRGEERQYGLHIPIIALSAHAMAEEKNKSIQAGMDFHLVKPLNANQLVEAIQSIKNNN